MLAGVLYLSGLSKYKYNYKYAIYRKPNYKLLCNILFKENCFNFNVKMATIKPLSHNNFLEIMHFCIFSN